MSYHFTNSGSIIEPRVNLPADGALVRRAAFMGGDMLDHNESHRDAVKTGPHGFCLTPSGVVWFAQKAQGTLAAREAWEDATAGAPRLGQPPLHASRPDNTRLPKL